MISNGFVMFKKGYEDGAKGDDFYFINNNKFDRNPMTASYFLRCFHTNDDLVVFNLRKFIYSFIQNPNQNIKISPAMKKMTIKDEDYFQRVIMENKDYISKYKKYKIRRQKKNNKYYYVITENGVFSGINYDLYLSILKLEIENVKNGSVCTYEGFLGIDKWDDKTNFVKVSYNSKDYLLTLKEDLSKIMINKKTVDLVHSNGSLNIAGVLNEIK